jgi:hypothetical protein
MRILPVLTALGCLLASCTTEAQLPSSWKIRLGSGGGIAAAYSGTEVDSEGAMTLSGSSLYPESRSSSRAQLTAAELRSLRELLEAAYPASQAGKTPAAPYYVWFDIELAGGETRSFRPPYSRQVERLRELMEELAKKYQPVKAPRQESAG